MCAEHCARLGPGGRSGATSGPPLQPKQQQLAEEVKDVDGGGVGRSAPAGAEADVPKASPEARPQIPTKPRLPSKAQELGSSPAGRPTPAPRKAPEGPALTPPTPRPRSSLQHENLAEQGGSSGLVNGEHGSEVGGHSLGCVSCLNVCVVGSICVSVFSEPCSVHTRRGGGTALSPGPSWALGTDSVQACLCLQGPASLSGETSTDRDVHRMWKSVKTGEAEATVGFTEDTRGVRGGFEQEVTLGLG